MTELTLPAPAADLWIETQDILTQLGPHGNPWTVHLGGGTILAARLRHRESSDINIVIRSVRSLGALARPGQRNLAAQLGGTPLEENQGQIKIRMRDGIIDLNTAPVAPGEGHEDVEISGRRQTVLSTTQILRGKLERANDPAPVRDVYDVIRAADDPKLAGSLAAAYGLLIEYEQDAIETGWVLLDAAYEEEAAQELRLTEEPRADLAMLGSTAALALANHRLSRLVITLEGRSLQIERTARNGQVFTDTTTQENARAAMNRLGVNIHISDHNGSQADVAGRIQEHAENRRSGVVFDTADNHPEQRLDGRNPSMKRAETTTTIGPGLGAKSAGLNRPTAGTMSTEQETGPNAATSGNGATPQPGQKNQAKSSKRNRQVIVRGEGRPAGGGTIATDRGRQGRGYQSRGTGSDGR